MPNEKGQRAREHTRLTRDQVRGREQPSRQYSLAGDFSRTQLGLEKCERQNWRRKFQMVPDGSRKLKRLSSKGNCR